MAEELGFIYSTPVKSLVVMMQDFQTHLGSNATITYDENLSYDSGLAKLRADSNLKNKLVSGEQILLYSRSVLRPMQERAAIGRRSATRLAVKKDLDAGEAATFKLAYGEFNLEFGYICQTAEYMEEFEVNFLNEEGINRYKQLEVCLDEYDLGNWKTFINWEPLTEKVINIDDTYYKMVRGSALMYGHFAILKNCVKLIKEISYKIYDNTNEPIEITDDLII